MSKVYNAFLNGFIKAAGNNLMPVPDKALKAEWLQETSGGSNWGITGDHGKALGPLQIHMNNFIDATNFDKSLANHPYSYVTNLPFAQKIYAAYQNRYNRPALEMLQKDPGNTNAIKSLFALWNGGPHGRNGIQASNYAN